MMSSLGKCLLGMTTLAAVFQPVSAVSMLYEDSLPDDLPSACRTALLADVACDRFVPDLRPDFFYPQKSLERICTSACERALSEWESGVRSACSSDVTIEGRDGRPVSPIYLPSTAKHIFKFTCLKENDVFCSPIAALNGVFNSPGVTIFNYLHEVPAGATKPSDCDPCLAARLRIRAGSPFFDDPVVASRSLYQSMTSSCGIAGKPVVSSTMDYTTTKPEPTGSTCEGGSISTIQPGDTCYSISKAKSVGTAWMLSDNNFAAYCANFPTSGSICIKNRCKFVVVEANTTCTAIAKAANITETQLLAYNPVINPVCSNLNLMNGTTLCIEPPGPKLPPAVTTSPPSQPTEAAPVPANAAQGSGEKPCGKWYEVQKGDYCNMLVLKYSISLDDFFFLNTGVNKNCTNLFADESYCIQAVGDINTYSGRPGFNPITINPNITFTGIPFTMLPNATLTPYPRPPKPSPLATGVRGDCSYNFLGDAYQYTADELGYWTSNCELAASIYNADHENFMAWNGFTKINITDAKCGFEKGKRYCGSWNLQPKPTPTDTNPPEGDDGNPKPPAATHTGQPADCNKWHVVSSGDTCTSVASAAGISMDTFFSWNPAVSRDCMTNFWLGQAYCIGTASFSSPSSTSGAATTTSATQTKPTPPGPTHPGQPSDCNKWDVVVSGETCGTFASSNSITLDTFFVYNPAVSRDCTTNFWVGQAYCVGISGSSPTTTITTSNRPTTTSGNGGVTTPPGPTHTGQAANCNKWDIVTTGETCSTFASSNGITLNQLISWNRAVSNDCTTNFWVGSAYCVGVRT